MGNILYRVSGILRMIFIDIENIPYRVNDSLKMIFIDIENIT